MRLAEMFMMLGIFNYYGIVKFKNTYHTTQNKIIWKLIKKQKNRPISL
ncbi:hypothetical protein SAMN05661044_00579 [Olivibacter domesticus]|uniref:Uncharacterized protein n=1 Tax=Olivibacter domesticus TaxID=407022 RepID=A0A1H7I3Y4_OLID1|nr:hypothetical protein SAMN05661044_00579 [Olivibacter domesticus]